jgi:hypothetical protein
MKRYEIIGANSLLELRDGVNKWVEKGYVPTGGPVRSERGPYPYAQAIWLPISSVSETAYDRKQRMLEEECAGEPY